MTEPSAVERQASRPAGAGLQAAAAALLLVASAVVVGNPATAAERPCPSTGKATLLQGELPGFAARFGNTRTLKIVTIGSSSTAGAGATSPANSYPSQLARDLARRFPGHDIQVVNAGANGQEVPDMLARLDPDVLSHRPDLVIWQFGSNGLLRGRPLAELEASARLGIERLSRAGVEVVMMDLQHAPRIDSVAARDDVLRMMQRLSRSTGAPLFHRYRLMKTWAAALGKGYAEMVAPDQLHMTDTSYRCMAGALAASLQDAVDRRQTASASPGGRFAAAAQLPLASRKSSISGISAISVINGSGAFSRPR